MVNFGQVPSGGGGGGGVMRIISKTGISPDLRQQLNMLLIFEHCLVLYLCILIHKYLFIIVQT